MKPLWLQQYWLNHVTGDIIPVEARDVLLYVSWFCDIENRRIGYTVLPDDVIVSTTFMGLDMNGGFGRPAFFETRVEGGAFDDHSKHYATLEAARKGHREVVQFLRRERKWRLN